MRTQEGSSPPAPPVQGPVRAGWGWGRHLSGLALIAAAGGVVAVFFLGLYVTGHFRQPLGWDTPRYLDQTNFVAARGLAGVPRLLPPPAHTLASRAGFPVVVLEIASVFGVSSFSAAAVVPAAAAVATALAAGAAFSFALRRPAWEAAMAVVVVGVSPMLVRLFAPETYTDNLLAAALVMAALVPLSSLVEGGSGLFAAIALLAAAGVAHQDFYALILGVIGLAAATYAPASWRTWRTGGSLRRTPAARLLLAGAGSLLVVAAVFLAVLRAAPTTPSVSIAELTKKLRLDLPLYLLPVLLPAAALGAWALARAARRRPEAALHRPGGNATAVRGARFLLAIGAAWLVVTVAGVTLFLAGAASPAHRFLAFFLPFPMFVAAAVSAGARWAVGRGRRPLAIVGVVAALVALAGLGVHDLYGTIAGRQGVAWILPGRIQDAAQADAYLRSAGVPADAPVVFVMDEGRANTFSYVPEMAYTLRAALSPVRVRSAYVYLGSPTDYLGGRPGAGPTASAYWPAIRTILPRRPVALLLRSYNQGFAAYVASHPARLAAPGVAVLSGPVPTRPVASVPSPGAPDGPVRAMGLGFAVVILLGTCGLGWAIAVLPERTRPFERVAVSPTIGIGAVLAAGILVDAAGARLTGAGGVSAILLAGLAGWGLAVIRRGRRPDPAAEPATPTRPMAP